MLIKSQSKILIKEIDLLSEQRDGDFYVYKIKEPMSK